MEAGEEEEVSVEEAAEVALLHPLPVRGPVVEEAVGAPVHRAILAVLVAEGAAFRRITAVAGTIKRLIQSLSTTIPVILSSGIATRAAHPTYRIGPGWSKRHGRRALPGPSRHLKVQGSRLKLWQILSRRC